MVNFKQIEEDAVKALKDVVHEAAANEPTIGALVRTALEGAGVPPLLATGAVDLVEGLIAHFSAHSSHATSGGATAGVEAPAAPGVSSATPEPSEPATLAVDSATPDPFAPPAGTGAGTPAG